MAVQPLPLLLLLLLVAPGAWAWAEEGFTDEIDGSRYSLWQDEPKPEDELKAKKAAEDIKCEVCEVILSNLLYGVGDAPTEDTVLNLLEGDISEEEVEAAVASRDKNAVNLAKGRKGCNRHFKDSFLRKGWDVSGCTLLPSGKKTFGEPEDPNDKTPPWMTVYGTCVKSDQPVQNETKMNTYSTRMEAIFWACQLTVGRHMEPLAKFLVARLKKGEELQEVVKEACRRKAQCEKLKYQGTYQERQKEAEKGWQKNQQEALDSAKKLMKEREKAEKASRRKGRRRASGGEEVEL